ncbi:conserved hypothetical protein, partial [Ixodes scapularis]
SSTVAVNSSTSFCCSARGPSSAFTNSRSDFSEGIPSVALESSRRSLSTASSASGAVTGGFSRAEATSSSSLSLSVARISLTISSKVASLQVTTSSSTAAYSARPTSRPCSFKELSTASWSSISCITSLSSELSPRHCSFKNPAWAKQLAMAVAFTSLHAAAS